MFDDDLDAQLDGILEHLEYVNLALYKRAGALKDEANREISSLDRRAIRTSRIGMAVRGRKGFWGPRLVWVRIGPPRGKATRAGNGQQNVPRATREFPMPDGVRVHFNHFETLDERIRERVLDFERRAREIRSAAKLFRATYMGAIQLRETEKSIRSAHGRSGSGLVREA